MSGCAHLQRIGSHWVKAHHGLRPPWRQTEEHATPRTEERSEGRARAERRRGIEDLHEPVTPRTEERYGGLTRACESRRGLGELHEPVSRGEVWRTCTSLEPRASTPRRRLEDGHEPLPSSSTKGCYHFSVLSRALSSNRRCVQQTQEALWSPFNSTTSGIGKRFK